MLARSRPPSKRTWPGCPVGGPPPSRPRATASLGGVSPEAREARFIPLMAIEGPAAVARRKAATAPPLPAIEVEHSVRVSVDHQNGLPSRRRPSDLVLGVEVPVLHRCDV